MRHLQSMLMVAAFQCPAYNFEAREVYNQFVRAHRQTLSNHNDVLKRHFTRAHGAVEGQRAYDRFTTTLANRDSDDSHASQSDYCEISGMIGREAIETSPQDLILLADDLRTEPVGTQNRCDAGGPMMVASLARRPATAPQPVAAVQPAVNDRIPEWSAAADGPSAAATVSRAFPAVLATVAAPDPAPVAASEAAPLPAKAGAAVPLLRKAAVVDAVGQDAASQADTAKALAAAAVALHQAAEALRAASSPIADAGPVARASVPGSKLN